MPWKIDLKASAQKVIIGDGRRSKKVPQNMRPSNKTNKTKTGVQAEVLNNLGLSNKNKPKQATYLGDQSLGVRFSTLRFPLIPISQMVLFLCWDSPRFVDTCTWTPPMFVFLFEQQARVVSYYRLTDAHGVVKESTSHVASRSTRMSIASYQED